MKLNLLIAALAFAVLALALSGWLLQGLGLRRRARLV
jgi:hypothetical protein